MQTARHCRFVTCTDIIKLRVSLRTKLTRAVVVKVIPYFCLSVWHARSVVPARIACASHDGHVRTRVSRRRRANGFKKQKTKKSLLRISTGASLAVACEGRWRWCPAAAAAAAVLITTDAVRAPDGKGEGRGLPTDRPKAGKRTEAVRTRLFRSFSHEIARPRVRPTGISAPNGRTNRQRGPRAPNEKRNLSPRRTP